MSALSIAVEKGLFILFLVFVGLNECVEELLTKHQPNRRTILKLLKQNKNINPVLKKILKRTIRKHSPHRVDPNSKITKMNSNRRRSLLFDSKNFKMSTSFLI
jgi:hypothetical protein